MKRLFGILTAIGLLALIWPANEAPAAQSMDIKDFVRQTFIHGVDYAQASQYGSDVVPALLEMLKDQQEQAHWANIAITLCIIGDEQALDPIISFIEEGGEGKLSGASYRAKTSAIMALGYLINKSGSQKALDYLKASIKPDEWSNKAKWSSPFEASMDERNAQLSTMAILGLALSGHSEATEALRSLQAPASEPSAQAFRAQVSGVVTDALGTLDTISKDGLTEYYRKMKEGMSAK